MTSLYIIPQAASQELSTRNRNISNPSATQAFGVVDKNGWSVEAAAHYRSGRNLIDNLALQKRFKEAPGFKKITGRWYYGGILFPHFGHFLTESLHRLKGYYESRQDFDGVIFLKSPQDGTFDYSPFDISFIKSIVKDYFKIDPNNVLLADSHLEFEDLTCRPQEQQLGGAPNPTYVKFLGNLESEFLNGTIERDFPEKIFLSRKNYLKAGRTLGMAAIENVFSENGFSVISPEEYPIKQQLGFIHHSKKIFCEAGSALHLIDILGPQTSQLVVLSRRGFDAHYWRNLYGNRVSKFTAFDKVLPMHHYFGTSPGAGHSLYHIQFLINFLEDLGLVFNKTRLISEIREAVKDDINNLQVKFA